MNFLSTILKSTEFASSDTLFLNYFIINYNNWPSHLLRLSTKVLLILGLNLIHVGAYDHSVSESYEKINYTMLQFFIGRHL